MSLLEFDYSGSISPEFGLTEDQVESMMPQLSELRDEIIAGSSQLEFIRRPKQMLTDYEATRDASELGRIFSVANRLHDEVDAVLVLGSKELLSGTRALMNACCHPFHNELSRGGRGSKPRMYFAGDHVDNDANRGLLDRLSVRSGSYDAIDEKWAIVILGAEERESETTIVARPFLTSLAALCNDCKDCSLSDLVFPITNRPGPLCDLATQIGCTDTFSLPNACDRYSVLSAASVLPAAILGMDCIQLLEGASAITEHFETAAASENKVLQRVAVNHQLCAQRGIIGSNVKPWNKALESLGSWCELLLGAENVQAQGICNHVISRSCSTDALPVGPANSNEGTADELADRTFPELMTTNFGECVRQQVQKECPSTQTVLREINTHTLGQVFQFMMLSATLASRLKSSH